MNTYEVTLRTGSDSTEAWEIKADHFKEQPAEVADSGPWLIFYRRPENESDATTAAPAGHGREVFRAPLHTLVAVQLEDEDGGE